MPTERDASLDAIKGLLILLVCLGHVPFFSDRYANVVTFLYTFHIPLFLAVSCSFISVRSSRDLPIFVRRRFLQIIVPFLAWVVVYAALAHATGRVVTDSLMATLRQSAAALGWANIGSLRAFTGTALLWFLPCVFCTNVIIATLRAHLRRDAAAFLLASLACVLLSPLLGERSHRFIPWGADVGIYVLPLCVAVSILYRRRDETNWQVALISSVIACGIGFVMYCLPIVRGLQSMIIPDQLWKSVLCDIFCLCAAISTYSAFRWLFDHAILVSFMNALAGAGRHSFGIYVTHPIIFASLTAFVRTDEDSTTSGFEIVALSLLLTLLAAGIGVLVSNIISRYSPLAMIFLGHRHATRRTDHFRGESLSIAAATSVAEKSLPPVDR